MRIRYVCSVPDSFSQPLGNGSVARPSAAAMMQGSSCCGSLRKSFFVEERHCSLNDAIALQLGNKLVVRYDGLFATLGNRG